MHKRILFILSTLALLMHPLSLSAQNSKAGGHVLNPDFDGNGQVDLYDFLAFAGQFGSRQGDGRYDARYDLDSDGEIGFSDFLLIGFDQSEVAVSFRQQHHGSIAFGFKHGIGYWRFG